MKLPAYHSHTGSDVSLSKDGFETLIEFLEEHDEVFQKVAKRAASHRDEATREVPSCDPEDGEYIFEPGPWVGKYTENVRVVQERVEDDVFLAMQNDVAQWIESAGPETARSLLRFLPDVLMTTLTRYRSYSQQLIEQTETVLAHRPPVESQFVRERGATARGRPLPAQTARWRAQGQSGVVTQRVRFSLETLSNALLIRFHQELAGDLATLIHEVPELEEMLQSRISYHRDFISDEFPQSLVDDALATNFSDPEILSTIRESASPEMERIVDLWEAFQSNAALAVNVREQLDTALKPIDMVYELYVLGRLIDILEDLEGTDPVFSDGLDSPISFGSVELRYDLSPQSNHSQLLKEGFSEYPGRPDYLLVDNGTPVWVGDAKFKSESRLRGYSEDGDNSGERFVRYLIDLLAPGELEAVTGTIVAPEISEDSVNTRGGVFEIEFLPLDPNNQESQEIALRETLERALS